MGTKKSKAKPKAAKAGPAKKAGKSKASKKGEGGRRSGLRGAAPWAARHAAKHAAEARARNASPAPPGSARATLRTPEAADEIKAKVSELHNTLVRIRALRKNFNDKFFELGVLLGRIKDGELYIAKGYSSFETFLEREIDLSKNILLRVERIPRVFHETVAKEYGFEPLLAALESLDGITITKAVPTATPAPRPQAPPPLPMKPPSGKR
jgi:hypothetical protein